jgi:hypothetical protein
MHNYIIKGNSLKRPANRESGLEVIQFNCNGLSNKLSEVKVYLYSNKPDILCLCETWLKRNQPKFIGYRVYFMNRDGAPKGGLAILVREDIEYRIKQITQFPNGGLEIQGIQIKYREEIIDVINCYNPGQNITEQEFLFYLSQATKSFIMIGDFNAHHPLWDIRGRSNFTGRTLSNTIDKLNIGILNDRDIPTYIDKRTGTSSCLDLCLVSQNLRLIGNFFRGTDLGSDHAPIQCNFGLIINKSKLEVQKRWKIKSSNWEIFTSELSKSNQEEEIESQNATSLNKKLSSKILEAANLAIPMTSGTKTYTFGTPWWDNECSKVAAQRKKAKGKLWKSPTVENLINYKKWEAKAKNLK